MEWLIDYFYWRRRYAETREVYPRESSIAEHRAAPVAAVEPSTPVKVTPDDLQVIKGIGPVIERKLNEAGIETFEQLGNLPPADLRRILGKSIERLADEEALLHAPAGTRLRSQEMGEP